MIKHYCDRCGNELSDAELHKVEIKIREFSGMPNTFMLEYCECCLATVIGTEKIAELRRIKEERKKRKEEKKRERHAEKNHPASVIPQDEYDDDY